MVVPVLQSGATVTFISSMRSTACFPIWPSPPKISCCARCTATFWPKPNSWVRTKSSDGKYQRLRPTGAKQAGLGLQRRIFLHVSHPKAPGFAARPRPNNHYFITCNEGARGVWLFTGKTIPICMTENEMDEVNVWYSIRFFLLVVLGITALGVAFFAVA